MEVPLGSIAHIFRAAFSQFYPTPEAAGAHVGEPLTPELSEEHGEAVKSVPLVLQSPKSKESQRPTETPKTKPNTATPRGEKAKSVSSPSVDKKGSPMIEQTVVPPPEVTPEAPDAFSMMKSLESTPQFQEIEAESRSRGAELDYLIATLRERAARAKEFDSAYHQSLLESGLTDQLDLPRIENKQFSQPDSDSLATNSKVVLAKSLVDQYQHTLEERTGTIPLPEKTFDPYEEKKHYLESTSAMNQKTTKEKHIDPKIVTAKEKRGNDTASRLPRNKRLTNDELAEAAATVTRMSDKINYLRNPRYENVSLCMASQRRILTEAKDYLPIQKPFFDKNQTGFLPHPEQLLYRDFKQNVQYEQIIELVNGTQHIRRLSFLPPQSPHFCIADIQYPTNSSGDIAPGLSCIVKIRFLADEIRDYSDNLIVISEFNQFIVPLIAKVDAPSIIFPKTIDFDCQLKGMIVKQKYSIENVGGAATFWFTPFSAPPEGQPPAIDSTNEGSSTFAIPGFTITPSVFFLDHKESIELTITFSPIESIDYSTDLQLQCSKYIQWQYHLSGRSEEISVEWDSLDGVISLDTILPSAARDLEIQRDAILFSSVPNWTVSKSISIRNNNQFNYEYEWVFYGPDGVILGDLADFAVAPRGGVLHGHEVTEFVVSYTPHAVDQSLYRLGFMLRNIPRLACKDESFYSMLFPPLNPDEPWMELVSGKYLEVSLFSRSSTLPHHLSRSFLHFGNMNPTHTYERLVSLCNDSDVPSQFEWRSDEIPSFLSVSPSTGSVDAHSSVSLTVSWTPQKSHISYEWKDPRAPSCPAPLDDFLLPCHVSHLENPLELRLRGRLVTPEIRFREKSLDFGVIKTNNSQIRTVEITNESDLEIRLRFSLRSLEPNGHISHANGSLSFSPTLMTLLPHESSVLACTLKAGSEPGLIGEVIQVSSEFGLERIIAYHAEIQGPIVYISPPIIDLKGIYVEVPVTGSFELVNPSAIDSHFGFYSLDEDADTAVSFEFSPQKGLIRGNSSETIQYRMLAHSEGRQDRFYYCSVEGISRPIGMKVLSLAKGLTVSYQVQPGPQEGAEESVAVAGEPSESKIPVGEIPLPSIDRIDFGEVELNSLTKLQFILSNYSSIATSYSVAFEKYDYSSYFEALPPSETIDLSNIHETGVASHPVISSSPEDGSPPPLGKNAAASRRSRSRLRNGNTSSSTHNNHISLLQSLSKPSDDSLPVALLDSEGPAPRGSGGLQSHSSPTFLMSGSQRPAPASLVTQPQQSILERTAERAQQSKDFLLSDIHEKTQYFSSAAGQTYIRRKQLEEMIAVALSGGRGMTLRCDRPTGELPPWSRVAVSISLYTDLPGSYLDHLVCSVEGQEPISFEVVTTVSGSPLEISRNCVGLDATQTPPVLSFPSLLVNSGEATKDFVVRNVGPRAIQLSWDVRNTDALNQPLFHIGFEGPTFGSGRKPHEYSLSFTENEGRRTPSPFSVEPSSARIASKGTQTFRVRLGTDCDLGRFRTLLVGRGRWSEDQDDEVKDKSKRKQKENSDSPGGAATPNRVLPILRDWVSCSVQALVRNPDVELTAKRSPSSGRYSLSYRVWSTASTKDESFRKVVTVANRLDAPMVFVATTSSPFALEGAPPQFTLPGFQTVDLTLWYRPSKIQRQPPADSASPTPVLSVANAGSMVLTFQNGFALEVDLLAEELRPLLCVDPVEISVASLVPVGASRDVPFFVTNPTEVTAVWHIEHVPRRRLSSERDTSTEPSSFPDEAETLPLDDPSVFSFSCSEGSLAGPTYSVEAVTGHYVVPFDHPDKLPLRLSLSFAPKASRRYESRFRVCVDRGDATDFLIRGEGTFDEISLVSPR